MIFSFELKAEWKRLEEMLKKKSNSYGYFFIKRRNIFKVQSNLLSFQWIIEALILYFWSAENVTDSLAHAPQMKFDPADDSFWNGLYYLIKW